MDDAMGMMDEGYFVSKTEILKWINDMLQLNLSKIEELGSGAVYCQLIDVIVPGSVQLSKVNWKAKQEYEFINNLKLLQAAFTKLKINRKIEIERLSKAKYQDNLEFIQWFKKFFEMRGGQDKSQAYDPVARRGQNVDFGFAHNKVVPKFYNKVNLMQQEQETLQKKQSNKENKPSILNSNTVQASSHTVSSKPAVSKQSNTNSQKSNNSNQLHLLALDQIRQVILNHGLDDTSKVREIANLLNLTDVPQDQQTQQTQFHQQQMELIGQIGQYGNQQIQVEEDTM